MKSSCRSRATSMERMLTCRLAVNLMWMWSLAIIPSSCVVRADGQAGCQETEAAALVEFYISSGFSGLDYMWGSIVQNKSKCACEWTGVGCDDSGFITSLSFSGEFSGSISLDNPSSSVPWPLPLAKLHFLKELSMDGFDFGQTPVPPEIGLLSQSLTSFSIWTFYSLPLPLPVTALANFSHLTHLALTTTQYVSHTQEFKPLLSLKFPQELCNLTSLQNLVLSANMFYGIIPSCLSLLPLSYLDLSFNMLDSISEQWHTSSNLTYIDLSLNFVGSKIPPGIFGDKLEVLHLGSNFFMGTIPLNTSTQLSNLTSLKLDNNQLTGSIPASLGNFTKLSDLSLSHNMLSGEIPHQLGNLEELQYLDLSFNMLVGGIPHQLGNQLNNRALDLSHNQLSGSIPSSLAQLASIQVLDLSHNQLSGSIPASLALLSKNSPYNIIDLSSNNLTGDLPWTLVMSQNIFVLNLASNHLTGEAAYDHNSQLANTSSSIQRLDLSANHITGPIPSWIGHLHDLTELTLSHNDFEASLTPGSAFSNLTSLTDLDLSSNNMQGFIPSFLYYITSLSHLDLSFNQLEGPIPSFFTRLTEISSLDLSFNQLNGTIPDWFWSFSSHLSNINLSMNYFRGDINLGGLCSFFSQQGSQFNVSHNRFNRLQEPKNESSVTQSNSSCVLVKFYILDLHSNHLLGLIPWHGLGVNFSSPVSFGRLNLADNFFFGSIPDWELEESTGYGEAHVLNLSHNELNGSIPAWITRLHYLQSLILSSNNFSGNIPVPACGTSEDLLAYLKVDGNSLSGSIPDKLGSCQNLVSLVLRDNLLTGHVSHTLSNLSRNLELLDLSHNNLDGEIPPWIQHMESLRVLSLSHNGFSGPLPTTKWNASQLQVLDLSFNNLHGAIPGQSFDPILLQGFHYNSTRAIQANASTSLYGETISVEAKGSDLIFHYLLTATVSLDLSNNAFTGAIPLELCSLDGLIFLSLSNNHLTGTILDCLGLLMQLNSLDLSQNKLVGEIPSQALCTLTFLNFVNVSGNNLSGPIPHCKQWETFTAQSFLGNRGLCGPPLDSKCSRNSTESSTENHDDEEEDDMHVFVVAIFVGFSCAFPSVLVMSMLWRPLRSFFGNASKWVLAGVGGAHI